MSAIGMQGDLFRGAKAIGMSTPCDFSLSALEFALQKNPDCLSFRLTVNPFYKDLAGKVVKHWMETTAPPDIQVQIVTDALTCLYETGRQRRHQSSDYREGS